jgi:hypothetical protein
LVREESSLHWDREIRWFDDFRDGVQPDVRHILLSASDINPPDESVADRVYWPHAKLTRVGHAMAEADYGPTEPLAWHFGVIRSQNHKT